MSSTVATLRVALPVPLPQLFDYLPPADAPLTDPARVGCRVRVPFGPRELVGVVVEIGQLPAADGLRPALAWCDQVPLLVDELARSLHWLARYTHAPLGEAQASALPGPLRRGEPLADTHAWAWQLTEAGRSGAASLRAGSRPALLAALLLTGAVGEEQLDRLLPQWREAARSLAKRAYAERVAVPADAIPP
ncbi:primosome assembly protein PriA, partial [Xanthomonas citri pv. aurantifolii]